MIYLVADSVWWDGRFRAGSGLRVSQGSTSVVALADIPAGADRRRLSGTLLPGLTDAHVHAQLVDLDTVRAGGIAGAWDLGGNPAALRSLRTVLPLTIAGQFLTAPGGYPSDRSWAPAGSWREVRSPSDAAEAVAEQLAAAEAVAEQLAAAEAVAEQLAAAEAVAEQSAVADAAAKFVAVANAGRSVPRRIGLIKVTLHAGGPLLSLETVAAVVAAAHAAGLPVVVHAEGAGTVATAVDAGADLLAHTPWTEPLDGGLLRAAGRMRWISTLDIHGYGAETPSLGTAISNLRSFVEHGGTVQYGTDLGNGPLIAGVNPREISALLRAGLDPGDILTAMTPDAATLPPCWIPGGLTLEPGAFPSVLVTARVVDLEVDPGQR